MTGINNWEYAKWAIVIGRSLRFNPPVANSVEYNTVLSFIGSVTNISRQWLKESVYWKMRTPNVNYNITPNDLGEAVVSIGRDMMKIPVRDAVERTWVQWLIIATGNRRYGAKGNTIGSKVTVP